MRIRPALLLSLAALAVVPAAASASGVAYPDADWTQVTITAPDGTKLHGDLLRPKGATDATKTPVILSIGPYFNHSGQVGPAGPAEDAAYDPVGPNAGPSERFEDFVKGSGLLKKGYSFLMVDLRGFGGSSGCLDWGGPGEQSDVVASIKWAASQPWSSGGVGMYGKSYDGVTGLIGVDARPAELKAVVSQEPVYDLYRYLYGDGQRRENAAATPALYDAIAATPGPLQDDPAYNAAALNDPVCLGQNWLNQAGNEDHASDYWKARNWIPGATGSDVPLFLTQGLTENNTVADGTAEYLRNHTGYERAWLGPWEHVRGNETDDGGRLKMGRKGWFDEVMRFYDRFLKPTDPAPAEVDSAVYVQTNDGKWRGEQQWPPADVAPYTSALKAGTYKDNGSSTATGADADATSGVWTISAPLAKAVHLSGDGTATVDVTTSAPRANIAIDVYDLDATGKGPLITRQGRVLYAAGDQKASFVLWSADWILKAGHRLAVRVTETNTDWWLGAIGTQQTVTVKGGTVTLPFLPAARATGGVQGSRGVQLDSYLARTVTVPAATMTGAQAPFSLPPAAVKKQRRTR
jgi:hypothetical protein